MRKLALTLTCTACVFGAFGVFCRWIQGMSAFEENGLYKPGSFWGIALIILYLAAFGAFLGFAAYFKRRLGLASPPEYGLATAGSRRIGLPVAAVMSLLLAGGGFTVGTAAAVVVLALILFLLFRPNPEPKLRRAAA